MEDAMMQTRPAKPTLWFGIVPALVVWAVAAASLAAQYAA
jgi:hypothetical protein